MMYLVLSIVVVALIGMAVYLALLPGAYSVRRSLVTRADIDTVFDYVRNYKNWPSWSPWLLHEPDAKLIFSDDCAEEGGYYTWEGCYIGAGKIIHEKFVRPVAITQKLEFFKPFKSICQVGFEFDQREEGTEITWVMQGRMPFLLRFMTDKTRQMIAKDYDLGLLMLNAQLDAQAEHLQIQFEGETELAPVPILCQEFSGQLQEMVDAMKHGFVDLKNFIESQNGSIIGHPLTAYHQVDLKKQHFVCDIAIPVAEGIAPGEYPLKLLKGGRYYQVRIKGGYHFLEMAWYSAMAHIHMLKLSVDKKRPSLEVYENDPALVSTSNEILTSLYIPLK